jgi:hypothetical protein
MPDVVTWGVGPLLTFPIALHVEGAHVSWGSDQWIRVGGHVR